MYAIRTKNGLLNGFYSNDLPITRKLYFNDNKERLEPKFSLRNMMNCSGGHYIFYSENEAQEHINYIKREVEENRKRYESVLEGSTDQLLSVVNGFKVIQLTERS